MPMSHQVQTLFASTSFCSLWGAGVWVVHWGLTWEVIPPILIGLASAIQATRGFLNDQQVRRHKEALHQAELERLRKGDHP
ncbi:hypothetical protein [Singulisphaera sp. PoT]|uniref:hypothetical protein n=1 Tax=Singulisphaera sp. PoT TaxID=3411797 RepID=UPI003BF4E72D